MRGLGLVEYRENHNHYGFRASSTTTDGWQSPVKKKMPVADSKRRLQMFFTKFRNNGGFPPPPAIPAWLRRMISRLLAIVPTLFVVGLYGMQGTGKLLIDPRGAETDLQPSFSEDVEWDSAPDYIRHFLSRHGVTSGQVDRCSALPFQGNLSALRCDHGQRHDGTSRLSPFRHLDGGGLDELRPARPGAVRPPLR